MQTDDNAKILPTFASIFAATCGVERTPFSANWFNISRPAENLPKCKGTQKRNGSKYGKNMLETMSPADLFDSGEFTKVPKKTRRNTKGNRSRGRPRKAQLSAETNSLIKNNVNNELELSVISDAIAFSQTLEDPELDSFSNDNYNENFGLTENDTVGYTIDTASSSGPVETSQILSSNKSTHQSLRIELPSTQPISESGTTFILSNPSSGFTFKQSLQLSAGVTTGITNNVCLMQVNSLPVNTPSTATVSYGQVITTPVISNSSYQVLSSVPMYRPIDYATFSTKGRQVHNAKERERRARMSCTVRDLRRSVPGLSSTTDKATVMEVTLDYLCYLRRIVGTSHDAEFEQMIRIQEKSREHDDSSK